MSIICSACPATGVLDRLVDEAADDIRTRRALEKRPSVRGFAETRYRAKSWKTERRFCARIEATTQGLDIRFVVHQPSKPARPNTSTRPSTALAVRPKT